MPSDYFSVEEWRAWAGANGGASLDEGKVLSYQAEVIERLEDWAYSAWPNVNTALDPQDVDDAAVLAGGGVSVALRSITEQATYAQGVVELSHVPVAAIVTPDPDMLSGFYLSANSGLLYNAMPGTGRGYVTVEYTFGYAACPLSIKRPCMMAVQSLARNAGEGNIPPNVERYTTEGTTFDMAVATIPGEEDEPWPWDRTASLLVRTRWSRHRPGRFAAV